MPDTSQPDSPTSAAPPRLKPGAKRISLALQGGGSHGAFTWGVMHRLMSEPMIYIDGISGTSAGAMNAVVFADGFLKGRRQGAIDALEQFWNSVARPGRHAAQHHAGHPGDQRRLGGRQRPRLHDARHHDPHLVAGAAQPA